MVVMLLVIIGGVNWLVVGATGTDYIKFLIGRRYAHYLYIVVGVAALILAFKRDVYLPFLGQAIIPPGALSLKTPQGANDTVTIKTRPGAKVIYWASEPNPHADSKVIPPWQDAYGDFENAGVVQADDQGVTLLRIRGPPQPYTVPMKGRIESHVHFRIDEGNGMFGPVQIKYLASGKVEGFADIL